MLLKMRIHFTVGMDSRSPIVTLKSKNKCFADVREQSLESIFASSYDVERSAHKSNKSGHSASSFSPFFRYFIARLQ